MEQTLSIVSSIAAIIGFVLTIPTVIKIRESWLVLGVFLLGLGTGLFAYLYFTHIPVLSIENKYLIRSQLQASSGPSFSGTVTTDLCSTLNLCSTLKLTVKTDKGHLCLSRKPICTNQAWSILCEDELSVLEAGQYLVTVTAGSLSVIETLVVKR